MPYRLSAVLTAHSSDVRALCTPANDLVLSASRDSTAISWQKSENGEFAPKVVFRPGTRYVNAITYLSPTSDAPKGHVVTGGQETVINVFSLDSPKEEPLFSLIGHSENVCALDATPGGSIISGSWDKTAKVWTNFQLAYDLEGHQAAVWAVKAIDEEHFLTGSADKTIKLWNRHKTVHIFQGHQDVVRGIVLIPDIGFASCSNDSEIRVWTLGGDPVYALSGHTSFVYSLAILPDGNIVSGGEDRSVRIWQGGECTQVIVHPAISVWAVATMPNGDIVSGCSDGVIRIFSDSEERWASAQELKDYEAQVASQALPSQQIGDVKKSDLPGPEGLSFPGKKPGEVKMIKRDDVVEAHQWDDSSKQWQKIGDVVDAVGSGRKQLYEGKEYDYVFDVDIQDGVPPLKLPYNVTENPYTAAQKFLETNEISANYLNQVARFIEKNTSAVNIDSGNDDYVDPYTGASRYRSSGTSGSESKGEYRDPFTGASRYNPLNTPAPAPPTKSTPHNVPSNLLPVTTPLNFKQANISAMQGKLIQFNSDLKEDSVTADLALSPELSFDINEIFAYLSEVTATPTRRPAKPITSSHVESVIEILERWPSNKAFPVIDLCRLLVGFSSNIFQESGTAERFVPALFKASEWTASWTSPLPKVRETNMLLVLRALANALQEGNALATTWFGQILEGLGKLPYSLLNKNSRVAFSTILFNISCALLRGPIVATVRNQYLTLILGLLSTETNDSEAAYRGLVALGNVAYAAKKTGTSLSETQAEESNRRLHSLPITFPEERIGNLSTAIAALL